MLSATRIIDLGKKRSYVTIWTENQSVWSSVTLTMPASSSLWLKGISHNSFVTWTSGGSLSVWSEIQGEWTNRELLSDQAEYLSSLLVLSDGKIVTVHNTHLSIWTEVDGVWSSIALDKGPGRIIQIIALPESRFLTL